MRKLEPELCNEYVNKVKAGEMTLQELIENFVFEYYPGNSSVKAPESWSIREGLTLLAELDRNNLISLTEFGKQYIFKSTRHFLPSYRYDEFVDVNLKWFTEFFRLFDDSKIAEFLKEADIDFLMYLIKSECTFDDITKLAYPYHPKVLSVFCDRLGDEVMEEVFQEAYKTTNNEIYNKCDDFTCEWVKNFADLTDEQLDNWKSDTKLALLTCRLSFFDITDEQRVELSEVVKNDESARNRLKDILDNHLENNYDYSSLKRYLMKLEKKNLLNI